MKLSEINKHLKESGQFIEDLKQLNFERGPSGVWFYRFRGAFLDVLAFWVSGSGRHLEVPVVCFKADLVEHCDMSTFPKGFIRDMPNISQTYVSKNEDGISKNQSPWRILNIEELSVTLELLSTTIINKIDPWLCEVNSDKEFFDRLTRQSIDKGYGHRIKDKLNLSSDEG